jgi:hypothetical protein
MPTIVVNAHILSIKETQFPCSIIQPVIFLRSLRIGSPSIPAQQGLLDRLETKWQDTKLSFVLDYRFY